MTGISLGEGKIKIKEREKEERKKSERKRMSMYMEILQSVSLDKFNFLCKSYVREARRQFYRNLG